MQEHLKKLLHFKALTGSKAYGLAIETSDDDWRGFYVPSTTDWFRLAEPVEQIETTNLEDYSYWEVRKYLQLLLKNNPNVLESMWSPVVEYPHPATEKIIKEYVEGQRKNILSKKIIKTYGGYATSQLKRGEEYVARGKTKDGWKHLMHLCRLLIQGKQALLTGELKVNVGEYKERLLDIRNEKMSMEDFKKWHAELELEFNDAQLKTTLPDSPDPAITEQFLINVRMIMLNY